MFSPGRSPATFIRLLLPDFVAVAEGPLQEDEDGLWPEEAETIKQAVPERRREFATGRNMARLALATLGSDCGPLLRDERGAPQWPEGFIGSIAHCQGYCAAAVMRTSQATSLGIDVEKIERITPEMIHLIASSKELKELLAPLPLSEWHRVATLVFSAKEALLKSGFSLSPGHNQLTDISLMIDFEGGTFFPTGKESGIGKFAFSGNLVAATWIEQ